MIKIQNLGDMLGKRALFRRDGKKIVFTNGCFDLLHGGHVHLLREAKKLGDVLIVAVNDDDSIKRFKGPHRPIFPLSERLEVLEAIGDIDYLVSFSEETPKEIITALLPDVLVKGGDWQMDEVVGREEVEGAGGEVVVIPYLPDRSSTRIIENIIQFVKSSSKIE
jgi:rfaE bifunctional protein nucleotidyltransferase chain/domain